MAEKMVMMGELYHGDDTGHKAGSKCGYCLECGDCKTYGCGKLQESEKEGNKEVDV